MSQTSLPEFFKGIALFTPGGDLIYCVDPLKQSRWHVHLCIALQEILELPEPPHFLVPCYTATIDRWFNPHLQQIEVLAEAHPLVLRHQAVLNAIFNIKNLAWKTVAPPEGLCDPMMLATFRHQFPQLWEDHDLIVRFEKANFTSLFHWKNSSASFGIPAAQPVLTQAPTNSETKFSQSEQNSLTQGYVLRLFVSGHSAATERILQRLHQFLEKALQFPYTLKVIDILKHPDQAEADQIFATPTLMRIWPRPARKIVGDLDNEERILQVLCSP